MESPPPPETKPAPDIPPNVISKETAHAIWQAHHEIHLAEKMLADMRDAEARGEPATPRNPLGGHRQYSLGVPVGAHTERMIAVSGLIARQVIEAHIASCRIRLVEASLQARAECKDLGVMPANPWVEAS